MADFVNDDGRGRLNIIGGGINLLGLQPTGLSSGFFILGKVDIPAKICPVEATIELALLGQDNQVIQLPGMDRKIRLAQIVTFDRPSVGSGIVPPGLRAGHQMIVNFSTGLPLESGPSFKWSLRVDGDDDRAKVLDFVVVRPPMPPVVG
jgi:hypothetical protein